MSEGILGDESKRVGSSPSGVVPRARKKDIGMLDLRLNSGQYTVSLH